MLNKEPDWPRMPATTPGAIRSLIQRCMEKDRERRLLDIASARNEIEQALQNLDQPPPREQQLPTSEVHATRTGVRRRAWFLATAVVVAALAIVAALDVGGIRSRLLGGAATPKFDSLAVLPLANLSGNPEQDYLAEGMHETLINDLAKLSGLPRVIARSSVMRYRKSDKPLPQIARELGVNAIITGSVQREGNRVRITAQLIDAESAQHLWAESYDREVADVMRLQSELARTIAQEINVRLTPEEKRRLAATRAVKPEVYEAYLRGKFYLNQGTPESIRKGLEHLRQAVERDPADPLAYAGLALGYSQIASHGPWAPEEAFMLAKGAAIQALQLNDTLAEAHAALAQIRLYRDWDWQGAEQSFRRALELSPNLATAHAHYAMYLVLFGRKAEAVTEIERAHQVDPLNPLFATWIGDVHWGAGEFDKAIAAFQKSLQQNPDFPWALRFLGLAYGGKGMYQEAIAVHEKAAARDPGSRWALAYSYALAGRKDEARRIAAEIEKGAGPNKHKNLAAISTALGERDEAFRWLDAAYVNRDGFTPWLRGPIWKPLRSDPRFHDLLRRLNLPPP